MIEEVHCHMTLENLVKHQKKVIDNMYETHYNNKEREAFLYQCFDVVQGRLRSLNRLQEAMDGITLIAEYHSYRMNVDQLRVDLQHEIEGNTIHKGDVLYEHI